MHYNFEMSRGNSSIFGISRVKLSNIKSLFLFFSKCSTGECSSGQAHSFRPSLSPLARCVPSDHGRTLANQLSWSTQGRHTGQVRTLTRSVHFSWVGWCRWWDVERSGAATPTHCDCTGWLEDRCSLWLCQLAWGNAMVPFAVMWTIRSDHWIIHLDTPWQHRLACFGWCKCSSPHRSSQTDFHDIQSMQTDLVGQGGKH
jgi:hypothetical protein